MSKSYLAKHYAKLILPLKPESLTEQENALIQTLLPEKGKILDIGAGTGRHLIPLAGMGYKVVGVESNEEMFLQLRNNLEAAKNNFKQDKNTDDVVNNYDYVKLFSGNINSINFRKELFLNYQNNFDLIILMWNTLNEIAYNKNELEDFLYYCAAILKPTGKMLVQLDQNIINNPEILNFETVYEDQEELKCYKYVSKLKSWDADHNISVCEELLQIFELPQRENEFATLGKSKSDNLMLEEVVGEVRQKWWQEHEVLHVAKGVLNLLPRVKIIA